MGKSRHLGRGSILHPANQTTKKRAGSAFADRVGVSTGGHSTTVRAAPRQRGRLVMADGPECRGVTVSRMDEPEDTGLTKAGRFRVDK